MCSVGHLVSQSRVCWWWYKNQWTTCGTCSPTDLIRGWQDEEETGGHNIATMPTQHCNHPLNIRVGRFCTFFRILCKGRYKTGIYQIFLILVQKPVRGTPLKVHIFKKIQGTKISNFKFFLLKNVFFNIFLILEEFQILNKNIFDTFFDFQKRVFFPKTSFAHLS